MVGTDLPRKRFLEKVTTKTNLKSKKTGVKGDAADKVHYIVHFRASDG